MKSAFHLLQSKIKNLVTRTSSSTPKPLPFNECSKSIVEARPKDSSVNDGNSKPALTIGTQLPKLPWEDMKFICDRPINEDDILQLQYLIKLLKDIHECQNEQYDFFQSYSKYLQIDKTVFPNILCLCAPMNIIKEQQDLLEKERNLKAEFSKKKVLKSSKSFWSRFRKLTRPQSEIDEDYAALQRIFNHLANDNNTQLKVIAFLSVVFSCQTGLVDEITGSNNNNNNESKEIESQN